MECKTFSKAAISSECFMIQAFGTKQCETCQWHNTEECGGKQILKTGMNHNGIVIGREGMEK